MKDWEFLQWLRDRLIHVYKEHPNTDFVLRLERIAEKLEYKEQQVGQAAN